MRDPFEVKLLPVPSGTAAQQGERNGRQARRTRGQRPRGQGGHLPAGQGGAGPQRTPRAQDQHRRARAGGRQHETAAGGQIIGRGLAPELQHGSAKPRQPRGLQRCLQTRQRIAHAHQPDLRRIAAKRRHARRMQGARLDVAEPLPRPDDRLAGGKLRHQRQRKGGRRRRIRRCGRTKLMQRSAIRPAKDQSRGVKAAVCQTKRRLRPRAARRRERGTQHLMFLLCSKRNISGT